MVHERTESESVLPRPIRELEDPSRLIGKVFDRRYRIVELVGRGGMSVVYRAVKLTSNEVRALKIMTRTFGDDDRHLRRFNQEALLTKRLTHDNTIRVRDYGLSEDGYLFLAMDFLDGRTLADELKDLGRIDPVRLCQMGWQVCASLREAHESEVVHRDLKPDNVFLLSRDDLGKPVGGDFIKVLDFGIAKFMAEGVQDTNLTRTGFICGTPLYVSPEQGLDEGIDHRSDLYSLGVLLFEALTGVPPFKADTPIGVVLKHIHEAPPDMRRLIPDVTVPRLLEDLIYALLEKNPADRPSTAQECGMVLERILRECGETPGNGGAGAPTDGRMASSSRAVGGRAPMPQDEEAPTRILVSPPAPKSGQRVVSMPSDERPTMYIPADGAEPPASAGAPPPHPTIPTPIKVPDVSAADRQGAASIEPLPGRPAANGDGSEAANGQAPGRLGPPVGGRTMVMPVEQRPRPGAPNGVAPGGPVSISSSAEVRSNVPARRDRTAIEEPASAVGSPKSRTGLWLIAVVAAVASLGGAWFFLGGTDKSNSTDSEQAASESVVEAGSEAKLDDKASTGATGANGGDSVTEAKANSNAPAEPAANPVVGRNTDSASPVARPGGTPTPTPTPTPTAVPTPAGVPGSPEPSTANGGAAPNPSQSAGAPGAAGVPADVHTAKVTITASRNPAKVYEDGKVLGNTPFRIDLQETAARRALTVHSEGFLQAPILFEWNAVDWDENGGGKPTKGRIHVILEELPSTPAVAPDVAPAAPSGANSKDVRSAPAAATKKATTKKSTKKSTTKKSSTTKAKSSTKAKSTTESKTKTKPKTKPKTKKKPKPKMDWKEW